MYRVNQIIKTISKMNSYAPYNQINKRSNLLRKVQVYSFLTSLISLVLMVIMAVIYKIFDLPKGPFLLSVLILYALNSLAGIIYLFTVLTTLIKPDHERIKQVVLIEYQPLFFCCHYFLSEGKKTR